MLTKTDFQLAILDTISNYPAIASFYRAGDPRIIQHLDAIATMLAMLSSQNETSFAEVFEKTRDATVLADAAIRGIVRKARPGKVRISLTNNSDASYNLQAGRNVLDSLGNVYRVDTPVTVASMATGAFDATQVKVETIEHTVSNSIPFYPIEIPDSNDGSYLSGIVVQDDDGEFEYRERYVNTFPDERVYHVESDDQQRIYVRFGQSGVVAVQPVNGHQISLLISRSVGVISPSANSPFSFEYVLTDQESEIDLKLNTVLDSGQNPIDMSVLRELIKYPSVYDPNAVYLSEFDFLVRRSYSDTQFLSVWNETIEEAARGASVDNINALFVAILANNGNEATLTEANPASPVAPNEILEANLTVTQKGIRDVILKADDSYKVRFYTPVKSEIVMTIGATISTAYDAAIVQQQIEDIILDEYGSASQAARRGSSKPLYQQIYKILRERVQALSFGQSDIQVVITPYAGAFRPELWRYVSETSLTVTVTTANITPSGWG